MDLIEIYILVKVCHHRQIVILQFSRSRSVRLISYSRLPLVALFILWENPTLISVTCSSHHITDIHCTSRGKSNIIHIMSSKSLKKPVVPCSNNMRVPDERKEFAT